MNLQLNNKVALVTGASRGIGFAIASKLAEFGCTIILLSRSEQNLKKAIKKLEMISDKKHDFIVVDLKNTDEVINKVNKLFQKLEKIDIIINNSSGPMPKQFYEFEQNDYLNYFRQIFLSANEIFKLCYPQMKNNKFGRIINITGTSTLEPIEMLSLSSLKSIFLTWTKSVSNEVGKYNITINNILPGPTNTDELKNIVEYLSKKKMIRPNEYLDDVISSMAIKRVAEPEEIANLVLFLVSKYASFITGNNIKIDGGFTKGF